MTKMEQIVSASMVYVQDWGAALHSTTYKHLDLPDGLFNMTSSWQKSI